jgi:hypothetical protein
MPKSRMRLMRLLRKLSNLPCRGRNAENIAELDLPMVEFSLGLS